LKQENPGLSIIDTIDQQPLCLLTTNQGNEALFGENVVVSNVLYLTNRFHFAVHLFSNRSQMTSKCGKNKKVAHEAIASCATDVLTTF